jgi:hypothetical protein
MSHGADIGVVEIEAMGQRAIGERRNRSS